MYVKKEAKLRDYNTSAYLIIILLLLLINSKKITSETRKFVKF